MFTSYTQLKRQMRKRLPEYGKLKIMKDEDLIGTNKISRIPAKQGVYLIYKNCIKEANLLYVGMSGSLGEDGVFGAQGLYGRLRYNTQGGLPRIVHFQKEIDKNDYECLVIQWFVTNETEILPATLEANLLQAYYGRYGKPPVLNRKS